MRAAGRRRVSPISAIGSAPPRLLPRDRLAINLPPTAAASSDRFRPRLRSCLSVVPCALADPEAEQQSFAFRQPSLVMGHPNRGIGPPIDHCDQVAFHRITWRYDRSVLGSLHETFVCSEIEAARLIAGP